MHNGQKDFICSICDYATSHKSNLERHKKVHGQGLSEDEDDEGTYIPEPEDTNIDVENDMDIEVEDTDSQTNSLESQNNTHDPMLESAPFHTLKKPACHKGKFCLPDRLRQTHEEEDIDRERNKEFVEGTVPATHLQTKESLLCNGQLQRSSHLQDPSSKVKIGGHKRLFANPYKCSDCTLSFPAQHQLAMHALVCAGGDQAHLPVTIVGSPPRGPEPDQPFSSSVSMSTPAERPPAFVFTLKNSTRETDGLVSAVTRLESGTIPSQSLKSVVHPEHRILDHNKDTWSSTDKSQLSPSRSNSPLSGDCNSRSLPLKKRCVNSAN